jgi:hypothetical protein
LKRAQNTNLEIHQKSFQVVGVIGEPLEEFQVLLERRLVVVSQLSIKSGQ